MTSEPATKEHITPSRKARDFVRREQEILSAALDCFCREDWESVTVAEIASAVGIAKGTMYLHFSGKHEIYARLTLNFYTLLHDHLSRCVTASTDDHLSGMVEQAFQFYLDRPKYRCVTQYCEREDFRHKLSPALAAEFASIDESFSTLIRTQLQRGIDSGRFKPFAVDQTIVGLQCTFKGALTLLWCNRHGEQNSPDQFIGDITRYMIAPLLADTDRSGRKEITSTWLATGKRIMESTNE